MRILTTSDTHGPIRFDRWPSLADVDVVCHTGDWAPDGPQNGYRDTRSVSQMSFFWHEGAALAATLGSKPFLFCLGNHDMLTEAWVERELRELGVNAFAPGVRGVTIGAGREARHFRGFRDVPWICGAFMHEREGAALQAATSELTDRWTSGDIILAHCPPQGPLAGRPDDAWGNPWLTEALERDSQQRPSLLLCGHIHEHGGEEDRVGITRVVNSACRFRLVDA